MAKQHTDKALTESQFHNGHTIKYIDDADSINNRRESLLLEPTKDKKHNQQVSSENNDKQPKKFRPREQWRNKAEFILTCIAFAVGLGNVWR